ncbi:MAG TPA: NAD(P)-binding domain-containing protein, partial [Xanthobacteraceae bacterium]
MTPTAWIGLGNLGLPMAARIAAAGVPLVGVDKDAARSGLAQARGIETAGTLESAVAGARIVVTSLPSDAVVLAVTTGPGGLFELMPRGAILAETSTIAPDTSRIVAERAARAGIAYLR